jgi:hypothetical protein
MDFLPWSFELPKMAGASPPASGRRYTGTKRQAGQFAIAGGHGSTMSDFLRVGVHGFLHGVVVLRTL